jgi:hypothetical protein
MPHSSERNLPKEILVQAVGLPHVLRTVEDALAMIEALPREISQLSRWTFAKALLQAALRSEKSRDLKTATRQLQQAISND